MNALLEPITKNAKGKYKVVPFDSEAPLREYIARLRTAHKTAERMLAQETERLNAMQRYRESIIPRLAQIRRHVFQNSRLNGYQIEGWEDAMGRSLLGTEADILVRGGIHDVGASSGSPLGSQTRPPLSTSSSQSVPTNNSSDALEEDEEAMNTVHSRGERRGSGRGVPDVDDQGSSSDPNRPMTVHDIRVVLSVGRAPLSTVAPGNMLGSEVLMQVDRQRQAQEIKDREMVRARSRSQSGREPEPSSSSGSGSSDHQQRQGSNSFSALGGNSTSNISNNQPTSNNSSSGEREGRKKSRGLFSFARGRRGSSSNHATNIGDAVVPSAIPPTTPIFQLSGRNNQSSVDISNNVRDRMHNSQDHGSRHRRNVPSISISNEDDEGGLPPHPLRRTMLDNASLIQLPSSVSTSTSRSIGSSAANNTSNDGPPPPFSMPSGPRVMSMDEYVGVGPVVHGGEDEPIRPFEDAHGSGPLIPSYGEHVQDQSIDPESMMITSPSGAFNGGGLGSLTEHDDEMEAQDLLLGRTSPSVPPPVSSSSSVFQPHHRSTHSFHLPLPSPGGRSRSRSLSPHPLSPYSYSMVPAAAGSNDSLSNSSGNANRTSRAHYQHHQYSFSDQTPDGSTLSLSVPPPDYAVPPPEYSSSPPSISLVFPTATSTTIASTTIASPL